LPSGTCRRI
jgi:hypothetical protein